jgi:hypothetical protein
VCPLNDSPWHNPRCLEGNCPKCGIDMLMICPVEKNVICSKLMQWKSYELVIYGKIKARKDNKFLRL